MANNDYFYDWLVGFFEADGCFSINHRGEIRFDLYQHSVDVGVLTDIKTRLSCGNIHSRQSRDMSTFTIYGIKQFTTTLYPIFNNRILSDYKFKQFKAVCDIAGLDAIKGTHNSFSWLTGFIDGDGSFFLSVTDKQIQAIFSIGQKEREVLDIINLKFFSNQGTVNGGDNIGKKHATYFILRFICSNTSFVDSFMKFTLLTKKQVAFKQWYNIVQMIQNKEHLTPEGRVFICEVSQTLNKINI